MVQVKNGTILGVNSSDIKHSTMENVSKSKKSKNTFSIDDLMDGIYGEVTSVKAILAVIPKEVNPIVVAHYSLIHCAF